MGFMDASKMGDRLYEISAESYPLGSVRMEHGGRLVKALAPGEAPLDAFWANRFNQTRRGCGVVFTNRRVLLLPESNHFTAGQAFMGALRSKGDVLELSPGTVRDVEATGDGRKKGFFEGFITGAMTDYHVKITLTSGDVISLESVFGDGRHLLLADKLRAAR